MQFLILAHIKGLLPILVWSCFDFDVIFWAHIIPPGLFQMPFFYQELSQHPFFVCVLDVGDSARIKDPPDITIIRMYTNTAAYGTSPVIKPKVS
jgi:hypothetical protein